MDTSRTAPPVIIDGSALYQVHDNGGRPFTVLVDEQVRGRVRVFNTRTRKDASGFPEYCGPDVYLRKPPRADELVLAWENLARIWVAQCPSLYAGESESIGNSLLLALPDSGNGHEYIHIGYNVFRFRTREPVIDFESPIDNNDVPYPAALSENEGFFLAEQMRMPRALLRQVNPASLDEKMHHLPAAALRWIFFYESLYGSEDERRGWLKQGHNFHPEAQPLEDCEELAPRP